MGFLQKMVKIIYRRLWGIIAFLNFPLRTVSTCFKSLHFIQSIFVLGWEECPDDSTEDDSTEVNDGVSAIRESTEDEKNYLQKMVGNNYIARTPL